MQKLIAKYGLAAHLAILAVAPLFLFPFCSDGVIAHVLLWLALPAAFWTVFEPSVHGGERLHEARRRVARAIVRDPLFWASLAVVVFTGFRALNTGISLSYDAEISAWHVSLPQFPILPGVVGSSGDLPFATSVACVVLLQACRHSLGRSARMSFFLTSSVLSGLAALIALGAVRDGVPGAVSLLPSADATGFSSVGYAFGLHLIGALVVLVAIFEQRWRFSILPLFLAIGGNAAGFFAFAPGHLSVALAAAGLLMLAYLFAFSCREFSSAEGLKLVVVTGIASVVGGLLVAVILPNDVLGGRLAGFASCQFFPAHFREVRGALSSVAFKAWIPHIWIGTGIDSFLLDFRFVAQESDWALLPRGATALPNGWWLLLVERGIVGAVFFSLPFGFLLFTYIHRLIDGVRSWELPHPTGFVAPLVLALFLLVGFFDCSPLRAEVLMVMCAFSAVSAAAFQREKGDENG